MKKSRESGALRQRSIKTTLRAQPVKTFKTSFFLVYFHSKLTIMTYVRFFLQGLLLILQFIFLILKINYLKLK